MAPQSGAIFMSERLGLNSNPNPAWIKEGMEEEAGKISVNSRQYLSIYMYIDVNCTYYADFISKVRLAFWL